VKAADHLIPAFEEQDAHFAKAFTILRDAIQNRAFPSCTVAVTHKDRMVVSKSLGRFAFELDAPLVETSTIFDLASVSKVVATTTTAMLLWQRGLLDLEMPVGEMIREFAAEDARRKQVTVRMLLAHSSGLPAYERLFERASTRDELLDAAMRTPLTADPGTRAEYSDIGFIVLGVALERLAGETLEQFCQREIFGPLGMADTCFNPPSGLRDRTAPTADDHTFRHKVIQGEVQDENCFVLGGVAGHAGVFSTAADVARFAHAIVGGTVLGLSPKTISMFTQRESSPAGTSRALGWDTPSAPSQSGRFFSPGSYGHLGYTGTSLWIDPTREISVTLLTNRTWPDCRNQAIKQVRPAVHDAIVEAVDEVSKA
jgi:CubicO group peptidase (beta-lactamase class C family)